MHRLVLLLMLLHQQSSSMNGVSGATSLHETSLVWRDVDKTSEATVKHSLKDLHCMTQQSYWPVVCTLTGIPFSLPDGHVVLVIQAWGGLFSATIWLNRSARRVAPFIQPSVILLENLIVAVSFDIVTGGTNTSMNGKHWTLL